MLDHVSNLNTVYTYTAVDKVNTPYDSSVAGLVVGKQYTVEALLNGLLLPSGGDCAVCLARNVAGSVPNFVNLMNIKARELGMTNTHFQDPMGYNDGNYSTPRQYMKLAAAAMNNGTIARISKMPQAVIAATDGSYAKILKNTNGLISGTISYNHGLYTVDGGKTGYTEAAGCCLTNAAHKDDKRVVTAVFGSNSVSSRNSDSRALLDYVFTH